MAAQVPLPQLFVAFSNGPLDANPVWTEIDQDLLTLDTLIGRQHQLDRIEPGTLTANLDNRRGDYSPWDTLSPFYNLLTSADSTFSTVGTWTASAGAVASSTAKFLYGSTSAQLTATATKETITSGHYAAATAGQQYSASAYMLANATGEQFQVGLAFFTSGGVQIGSTTFGTATADNSSTWSQLSPVTAVAPGTTAFVAVVVSSVNTTSNTHFVDCVMLSFNPPNPGGTTTPMIGWTLGQTLPMVPGKPVKAIATWPNPSGTPYPVFYGFVDAWTPVPIDEVNQNAQLKASDALKLLNLKYLVNSTLYPNQVASSSPLLYYRLAEEQFSTGVTDSTTNNRTGQYNGTVTFGQAGSQLYDPNFGISLNGSGWLTAPTLPNQGSGAFSTECWFKTTSALQQLLTWASNAGTHPTAVFFGIDGNGRAGLFDGNANIPPWTLDGLTQTTEISGPTVNDGLWHHVVVTMAAPSGGNSVWTLYIDGVSCGTWTGETWSASDAQPLYVGGIFFRANSSSQAAQGTFTGQIDELAVYGSVLSGATIAQNYTIGSYFQTVEFTGQRIAKALLVAGYANFPQNIATGTVLCQKETSTITATFCGSYCLSAADTENGLFYQDQSGTLQFKDRHYPQTNPTTTSSQGTYGDQGGANSYDVTGLQLPQDDLDYWPEVLAQRNNGIGQLVSIAAAVSAGGDRTLQRTGLLANADADMLYLAEWLSYLYSNPAVRCAAVKLNASFNGGANLPQMLGRVLWDCVTFQRQGTGESQLNKLMVVESVSHHFDTNLPNWETTFQLSPFEVSPAANLALILNSATNGLLNTNVVGG